MAIRLTPCLARLQAACLVAWLAGCAQAPLPPPAALAPAPVAFKGGQAGTGFAVMPADGQWWRLFEDPQLDQLVARAEHSATSIQLASAQLARARALLRLADAGRAPQAAARASAGRQGGPLVNAAGDQGSLFAATVHMTWEADLLGRLDHARQAAALDQAARQALLEEARLLVRIDLVRTYLALRAVDAERPLVLSMMAELRSALAIMERRLAIGQVSEASVARVRMDLAGATAELPELARRRDSLEHALAVLLGEPAPAFHLAEAVQRDILPRIPAGVPGSVLTRRPDVAAALDAMLAARERIGVAAGPGLPELSLSASGGVASSGLGQLVRMSARTWGLGALASLPLFDGGRQEAGVQVAQADLDAAQALYRARYLAAMQEVEDQLSALRALEAQAEAAVQAADAARQLAQIALRRRDNGMVSELELLDARRASLRQERQQAQLRAAQVQATVALVRVLGGGWE